MKLKILDKDAKDVGSISLPSQFDEPVRVDLIKRAVLAIQANNRQPYGASPEAGKRASAYVSKRRRAYKTTYGIGQSRTPRKILSRSGTRMNWVGAFAPQTVGGRRAHPPKASKIWSQKINLVERRKAIRGALSATLLPDLVKLRGHIVPDSYPFVLSDDFNNIAKTSELKKVLINLGFLSELNRANVKSVRAGKGKARGRKYKTKKSVLFVVSTSSELFKSASNLLGCDVVLVSDLNAELLAPGAVPGRLTLFTKSAIEKLNNDSLFSFNKVNISKKVVSETKKITKLEEKPAKKVAKKPVKKVVKKEVEELSAQ
jgi:large subunit ribosomal protein L4e